MEMLSIERPIILHNNSYCEQFESWKWFHLSQTHVRTIWIINSETLLKYQSKNKGKYIRCGMFLLSAGIYLDICI